MAAAAGGRSTCAGGGRGATGSGIGAGGRITSGPGATRLAGGTESGPIGIGPELVKGWAHTGVAQSVPMAQAIAAAAPALDPLIHILAFSTEIAANSSLYRPSTGFVRTRRL